MGNWLTPKLAASYCHVDAVTLRRAVKGGALQAFRVNGGRRVRFRDALGHSSTTMTSTYLRTRTDSLTSAYERRAAHQARQTLKVAR